MDDFKLVEEFLSKKNLDGIDKFLLEKYMGAIRNVLNINEKMVKYIDQITEEFAVEHFYNFKFCDHKCMKDGIIDCQFCIREFFINKEE